MPPGSAAIFILGVAFWYFTYDDRRFGTRVFNNIKNGELAFLQTPSGVVLLDNNNLTTNIIIESILLNAKGQYSVYDIIDYKK